MGKYILNKNSISKVIFLFSGIVFFITFLSLPVFSYIGSVPTGAMSPTIKIGDKYIVKDKIKEYKRGDIVVFLDPSGENRNFLKRLIALGGESVEMKKGDVYINEKLLSFPKAKIIKDNYNYGPKVVPVNYVFVLGDNRPDSADSRYFGFIPKDSISGKAVKIIWPWKRWGIIY
ncbi:signal peptidase I [Candidatus Margulisiibacteriota bacterium]